MIKRKERTILMTGYPSIDKPWLKFYSKDEPCVPSPNKSIYAFLKENTQVYKDWIALDYYGKKVTYKYVFVDEFPITRAGKVDYMELVKWDGK